MKKRRYSLSQQCMACCLLVSLFLQSCNGFSNPLVPIEGGSEQITQMEERDWKLVAQGGHQVSITEQAGTLQATVGENLPVGFSKTHYCLPVYLVKDIDDIQDISHLKEAEQKRLVEVCLPSANKKGHVYIGRRGLVGGMKKAAVEDGGADDEKNKIKNTIDKADLQYDPNHPKEDLLGEGNYGKVYKGMLKKNTPVAIKFLNDAASLLGEVNIMDGLKHTNIVTLFGVCDNMIVTELMSQGSVEGYLKKSSKGSVSPLQVLNMAIDTANGMKYLHDMRVIHRDLAARNLLLATDDRGRNITKIADFGLSRQLKFEDDNYPRTSIHPQLWSAPESFDKPIGEKQVTIKSDVWSYGVTLYELFTFCKFVPYAEAAGLDKLSIFVILKLENKETKKVMYQYLQIGDCPEGVQEVLNECLNYNSHERPDFNTIIYKLSEIRKKTQQNNTWKIPDKVSLEETEGTKEEIKDTPYREKENDESTKDEEGEDKNLEQATWKGDVMAQNKLGIDNGTRTNKEVTQEKLGKEADENKKAQKGIGEAREGNGADGFRQENRYIEKKNDQKKDYKESLQLIQTMIANEDSAIRRDGIYALKEIVKVVPELSKKTFEVIERVKDDKDSDVRLNAIFVLQEIMKVATELKTEAFLLVKTMIIADKDSGFRNNALFALKEIVKIAPELSKESLQLIQTMIADKDVRQSSISVLKEIVKVTPELSKESLQLIKSMMADKDYYIRRISIDALKEIVKIAPDLRTSRDALIEIVEVAPKLKYARDALIEIVKVVPELRKEVLQLIQVLMADKDAGVRLDASKALEEIVKEAPELSKESLQLIQTLMADKDASVRLDASKALEEIVKVVPELKEDSKCTIS